MSVACDSVRIKWKHSKKKWMNTKKRFSVQTQVFRRCTCACCFQRGGSSWGGQWRWWWWYRGQCSIDYLTEHSQCLILIIFNFKGKTIVQGFVIQGNLFQAFSGCRHASAEAGERQALLLCSHAIVNNPELGMGYSGHWLSCLVKCDL